MSLLRELERYSAQGHVCEGAFSDIQIYSWLCAEKRRLVAGQHIA